MGVCEGSSRDSLCVCWHRDKVEQRSMCDFQPVKHSTLARCSAILNACARPAAVMLGSICR